MKKDVMTLHTIRAKLDGLWANLAETRRLRRRYGRHNPERETSLQNQIAEGEREILEMRAELAEDQAAWGSLFIDVRRGITRESLLAYAAGCRARMLQPFF